jgi:hypothetical protein
MSRIGLFGVAAGLPVLSISAHVFGIMPINWAAVHVVLPALLVALGLVLARVPEATVVTRGAAAGLIAVAMYDFTRLPFVLLGLWSDFIPRVGGWVVLNEGFPALHAVLGYTWRYLGNGLGIGVFFFLACSVLRVRRHLVALGVAYGVFVWSGLMATVALAPHGQELLFALKPLSVTVSLTGHLVYGLVLGLIKVHFARRDAASAADSPLGVVEHVARAPGLRVHGLSGAHDRVHGPSSRPVSTRWVGEYTVDRSARRGSPASG